MMYLIVVERQLKGRKAEKVVAEFLRRWNDMLRYAKTTLHNMYSGLIFGACISAYIFYILCADDVFNSRILSYVLHRRKNTKVVKPIKRTKVSTQAIIIICFVLFSRSIF
jgi:hypothetical protein